MKNLEPGQKLVYSFNGMLHQNVQVNRWLRFASWGWDKPQETIEQREIVRRSRLTAWILLGALVTLATFIPATLYDLPSVFSVIGSLFGILLALFLNRQGFVTTAGSIFVILMCAAILGVVVAAPGGSISLVYLPAYDVLAIPVVVAASILPRWSGFVVAATNALIIYADLFLQPKSADLQQAIAAYSLPVIAGRPISILIMVAVIAYLWVRGMDDAVKRADRAEELHKLQQEIAQVKTRWSEEANDFVQGTVKAVAALANGQDGQIALPSGHSFFAQAAFINIQLHQFYKMKQTAKKNDKPIEIAAAYLLRVLQGVNDGQLKISSLNPKQFSTQTPIIDDIAKQLYSILQNSLYS